MCMATPTDQKKKTTSNIGGGMILKVRGAKQ